MKVLIKDLFTGPNCFQYSEEVETYIANEICSKHLGAPPLSFTSGYAPEYDFTLGDKRIELKLTSKSKPSIEFARGDGRVSGLLLSEADYYLIVSPGGSGGKFVGKFRLIKTTDLKANMICAIADNNLTLYPPSDNSPGSMCYTLDPRNVDDIWVGDCDLIRDCDDNIKGFDLSTFKPSYGKFINNAIRTIKAKK